MPAPKPAPRRPHVTGHKYDPDTGNLDVTFASNRTYRYAGVPLDRAEAFRDAPSLGTFLHKHIIPDHDAREIFPDK